MTGLAFHATYLLACIGFAILVELRKASIKYRCKTVRLGGRAE